MANREMTRHSSEQRWHPPGLPEAPHAGRDGPVSPFRHTRPTRLRRRAGLLLGPTLLIVILAAPLPLTLGQHRLLAVLAFAVTCWVTEALPIPVTSILVLGLCVGLNVPRVPRESTTTSPAEAVFSLFSSPTMFLMIGAFIMAQAMIKYDLGRRIALLVLTFPGVGNSTYRIVIAFGVLSALLSSIMDNGAVVTILLPIAIGTFVALDKLVDEQAGYDVSLARFGTALMLMTAYGATVGGLLTPIGDSSNLLGQQLIEDTTGTRIGFTEWVQLAVPIVLVLLPVLCFIVLVTNRPEVGSIVGAKHYFEEQRAELGPLSRGEVNTLIAFGAAILVWVLPSLIGILAGEGTQTHLYWQSRLHPSVGAILGASLLFLLPSGLGDGATLLWRDAMKIDWGTLLVVGTGLTLGTLTYTSGLADVLGHGLANWVGAGTPVVVVQVVVVGTAILVSELASNTASVGVMLPVIPVFALVTGVDPLTLSVMTVFAATYGFMLPVSTSANAIAFSTGAVPMTRMVRSGLLVDLSGLLAIITTVSFVLPHVGLR
jgi:sodium-dependent dicarboxylate transporter 2/3/5